MKTTLFLSFGIILLTSCSSPEPQPVVPNENQPSETLPEIQPFLLTQASLDSVLVIVAPSDTAITGNAFGVRTDGSDRNIKDIYTNKPLNRAIRTGDIFVIRSFQNIDGVRGPLDFVDIMVRRESGFNATAGDFEYFRMDFDATTDYSINPNGLVPTLDNSRDRGTDIARAGCVACHRLAPGSDFHFTVR